jgi:hypothetical protein
MIPLRGGQLADPARPTEAGIADDPPYSAVPVAERIAERHHGGLQAILEDSARLNHVAARHRCRSQVELEMGVTVGANFDTGIPDLP